MTRVLVMTGALFAVAPLKPPEVSIVVAAVDIPSGTVVTFDMISQRQVPAGAVTTSIVKPDSASYIVNQRIALPVLAGDPMLWSFFETASDAAGVEACRKVLPEPVEGAAEQISQARAVALQAVRER